MRNARPYIVGLAKITPENWYIFNSDLFSPTPLDALAKCQAGSATVSLSICCPTCSSVVNKDLLEREAGFALHLLELGLDFWLFTVLVIFNTKEVHKTLHDVRHLLFDARSGADLRLVMTGLGSLLINTFDNVTIHVVIGQTSLRISDQISIGHVENGAKEGRDEKDGFHLQNTSWGLTS